MAVKGPTSYVGGVARDVLHVVVAPSSPAVLRSVLSMLRNLDRGQWYASLLIEGGDDAPDGFALAQAAREIGVPVMPVRMRQGSSRFSRLRMAVDEWFLIRNAHAVIVHVHSPAPLTWWRPVNWVRLAMPRLPFILSVYGNQQDGGMMVRVDACGRRVVGEVGIDRLYEATLASRSIE